MPTALEFQLAHQFDELCRRLHDAATGPSAEVPAGLWDLPLAYWAVPKDRRLPRALLGYPLRRIVQTPFGKLRATPGIGVKKLATLIELLERALASSRNNGPPPAPMPVSPAPPAADPQGEGEFDPAAVSESQGGQWCEAVKRHGLDDEPLGRFALTLRELPGVLWRTPLSDYAGVTLEELRDRKTHGEKRVRAIIEVFAAVQSLLGEQPLTHLSVRIVPGFAAPLEAWLLEVAGLEVFPSAGEVQEAFIDPLIQQLRHDAGQTVSQLAADRLLTTAGEFNVRAAASQLGLTRARVYQLLAEASGVMSVRWPEGASLVHGLREKVRRTGAASGGAQLYVSAADLFYPRRGGTAGSGNGGSGTAAGRAQRGTNDSDSEDQPVSASPRPPGHARSPRRKGDRRENGRTVKPGRAHRLSGGSGLSAGSGLSGAAASIDTSTCCPT
jgi:hypothetical protein